MEMSSSSSCLMGLWTSTSSVLKLFLESRESRLSLSGFFIERFKIGADCGRSSLFEDGWMDETPLEVFPDEDAAEVADPVDSHSKESVPLSPKLRLI